MVGNKHLWGVTNDWIFAYTAVAGAASVIGTAGNLIPGSWSPGQLQTDSSLCFLASHVSPLSGSWAYFFSFQTEVYTRRQAHTRECACTVLNVDSVWIFSLSPTRTGETHNQLAIKKITQPQSLLDHHSLWLINPVSGTFLFYLSLPWNCYWHWFI